MTVLVDLAECGFAPDWRLIELPRPLASPRLLNGIPLWDKVLELMPRGSVVAGGAVRDHLLMTNPKDIDVFVSSSLADEIPGWLEPLPTGEASEDYQAMTRITRIRRGDFLGHTIDAIVIQQPGNLHPEPLSFGSWLVSTFDFGLTRSFYHPDTSIVETGEARFDRENRCVTLLDGSRLERAERRFDSFNARHGGDWIYRQQIPLTKS